MPEPPSARSPNSDRRAERVGPLRGSLADHGGRFRPVSCQAHLAAGPACCRETAGRLMPNVIAPAARSMVLVVDDVRANRELLQGYLDDLGYDVREARDGVEALEVVEAEEPDLILLDIDMPRLDGIAVCERLKAHPVRRLIPIVILTASNDRGMKLRGIAAGADDYLSKPFDSKELLIRTKVLLRQRALNQRLDATEGVLFALARAVEARDRHTIHHAERVGRYAEAIGGAEGLGPEDCELLYQGGVLHDLGKIAIPDAI